MRISVEKASDGAFIVEVPCKPKKDKGEKGHPMDMMERDLKYTAKTDDEAIKIIKEALKDIKTPEDEYSLAFDSASKEQPKEK